jgi:hypothetical protein
MLFTKAETIAGFLFCGLDFHNLPPLCFFRHLPKVCLKAQECYAKRACQTFTRPPIDR